jgi:osmotically inducible protein OsmC
MQLSHELASAGTPPERLDVSATVTFDRVGEGWGVTQSALTVRGRVPGATADAFRRTAESAKNNCPISRTLQGNVQLSVEATLE